MATTLLNTAETYSSLQPFKTIEELNANTTRIRELYADQMNPSTYKVLDVLHRWSCKFVGVCFLAKGKIAELIGMSRKTVTRACKILEDMGVIKQYETRRKNGDKRRSTNIIQFVVVDKCTEGEVEIVEQNNECTNHVPNICPNIYTPLKTPKNTKTLTDDTVSQKSEKELSVNDKENLNTDRLPSEWYKVSAPYAKDYDDLYNITGILYKAKHGLAIRIEDHIEDFGMVLRKAWTAMKTGRVERKNWYGYLFKSFKNLSNAIQAHETFKPNLDRLEELFDPELEISL